MTSPAITLGNDLAGLLDELALESGDPAVQLEELDEALPVGQIAPDAQRDGGLADHLVFRVPGEPEAALVGLDDRAVRKQRDDDCIGHVLERDRELLFALTKLPLRFNTLGDIAFERREQRSADEKEQRERQSDVEHLVQENDAGVEHVGLEQVALREARTDSRRYARR